jgi:hypothetical protein
MGDLIMQQWKQECSSLFLEFSAFPGLPFAGTIGVGDVIANVSAFARPNIELKLTHNLEILFRTHVDSIFFAAQVPQVPESSTLFCFGRDRFVCNSAIQSVGEVTSNF